MVERALRRTFSQSTALAPLTFLQDAWLAKLAAEKKNARRSGRSTDCVHDCEDGTCRAARAYWQASQVPPLRMASMEQAFRSSAVYSRFSGADLRSRFALSIALLFSVRR